ncbi:hypothetical protein BD410DRAFT_793136 [Rickenella mellea]|uniref:CENP-V/GFA domain-containing protein n=1 Tax=Rickenella mellea TaxID=50990 RepID=A0A4Y7PU79_9AGAM|nr:hypothetical protein BD410DRAFT_793136 [Rickenella mellea]
MTSETPTPSTPSLPVKWPENAVLQQFTGSCHCKKFAFTFQHPSLDTVPVVSCNCSICTQRGYLVIYVPTEYFTVVEGSMDALPSYSFGRERVVHRFYPNCGSGVSWSGKTVVAVNLCSVEGVDFTRLTLLRLDGANT